MQLAQVKGYATSTVKHPSLASRRLLICQVMGVKGQAVGDPVLAVDRLGAGRGDRVILTSDGPGLRQILADRKSPVRWWTLAIVDE